MPTHATTGAKIAASCYSGTSRRDFATAPGQTFTTVADFTGDNGSAPGPLVQGIDENLYGPAYTGGAYDHGTVFKITPSGIITTLYSFCAEANCADGAYPEGGLLLATDGNFYGTTNAGGANEEAREQAMGRYSRSARMARSHCCTVSTGMTAPHPSERWLRARTGASTGQPKLAAPTAGEPSSASPRPASSPLSTASVFYGHMIHGQDEEAVCKWEQYQQQNRAASAVTKTVQYKPRGFWREFSSIRIFANNVLLCRTDLFPDQHHRLVSRAARKIARCDVGRAQTRGFPQSSMALPRPAIQ
jgi:uncharacterized repeat protein (TIGR03803 family)